RPCDASPSTGSLKELKPQDKGFYVLGQNAMPGWRAWVDGKPVDLFLADGIFLAAPIPPNSHWVKFAYEPASFRFGLFLSLTAVMGLMGWFGWRRTA
ncbi:MAG TPA: YfhO family protein, partial [bacterium]|nr:YfhO family protein [bacterium]